MVALNKPLFKLGKVVATPGALESLDKASQTPWEFVSRHVQGDFGEVDAEDRQANEDAIKDGSRILSAYKLKTGVRIWVITEADRSSTCLLLPERVLAPGVIIRHRLIITPTRKDRTMIDNTDAAHRDRQTLEAAYGKVWDEDELVQEFKVTAIIAPKVVVVCKADGQVGSMEFQNQPRFYFNFQPNPGFGDA